MTEPIVTVVISPREGYFLSERSLLSVLGDDEIPFELLYIDIASPPSIARAIQAHAKERGFKVLRHDRWIAPSAARKRAFAEVRTKYAACIDNDILVEPGCLRKLVACAEETGAALVCPLYVEAGGGRPPTIHMAGGRFFWSEEANARLIAEGHLLSGAPVSEAAGLARMKVDYTEYHYVLGRMELLGRPEAVSDDILLIHEHLDLALYAREHGLEVFLEPSARATYVAFESRPLQDIAFFRRRWDVEACHQSLHAFARKRLTSGNGFMIDAMLAYPAMRLREVELRHPRSAGEDLAEPMAAAELAQTRSALREQALSRGYSSEEVLALERIADFATLLFDGLYRPDGRPFLNHAIGTASALVRYELDMDIVRAGLLRAAYIHRPEWIAEAEVSSTLAAIPAVGRLIRGQPQARAILSADDADLSSFNVVGASVACILAANNVEMRLSGEYSATGRPADLTPAALDRIDEVLSPFGVDGLARSARLPPGEGDAWPLMGAGVRHTSFRLDARNRRLLPISGGEPS